jgi:hypothetical protein
MYTQNKLSAQINIPGLRYNAVMATERLRDVEDRAWRGFLLTHDRLWHAVETRLAPLGVSMAEYSVLALLGDARLVLDAYLLRSLAVAGYAPALGECARCGSRAEHRAFAVHAGGMVCSVCRPHGTVHPSPETLRLMEALLEGDWGSADASADGHRSECSGLVAAYLQWHLENGIRSLRLVERA